MEKPTFENFIDLANITKETARNYSDQKIAEAVLSQAHFDLGMSFWNHPEKLQETRVQIADIEENSLDAFLAYEGIYIHAITDNIYKLLGYTQRAEAIRTVLIDNCDMDTMQIFVDTLIGIFEK